MGVRPTLIECHFGRYPLRPAPEDHEGAAREMDEAAPGAEADYAGAPTRWRQTGTSPSNPAQRSVQDQLHSVLLLLTTGAVSPDDLYQPIKDGQPDARSGPLQVLADVLPVCRM